MSKSSPLSRDQAAEECPVTLVQLRTAHKLAWSQNHAWGKLPWRVVLEGMNRQGEFSLEAIRSKAHQSTRCKSRLDDYLLKPKSRSGCIVHSVPGEALHWSVSPNGSALIQLQQSLPEGPVPSAVMREAQRWGLTRADFVRWMTHWDNHGLRLLCWHLGPQEQRDHGKVVHSAERLWWPALVPDLKPLMTLARAVLGAPVPEELLAAFHSS